MTNLMIAMHSDKPPQACTQTSGGTMEGNVVVGSLKLIIPKFADCYNLHCLQLFLSFHHLFSFLKMSKQGDLHMSDLTLAGASAVSPTLPLSF